MKNGWKKTAAVLLTLVLAGKVTAAPVTAAGVPADAGNAAAAETENSNTEVSASEAAGENSAGAENRKDAANDASAVENTGDGAANATGSAAGESTAESANAEGTNDSDAKTEEQTAAAEATGETVPGKITIDGNVGDWAGVSARAGDGRLEQWKTAKDAAGNIYFAFYATSVTQWDDDCLSQVPLTFTQNGKTETFYITKYNWNLNQISGVSYQYRNTAHWNTPGPYAFELLIPASYISNADAALTVAGTTIDVSSLPVFDGNPVPEGKSASYEGITIDGNYSDWDPVAKTDASDPNGELESVASVWDGDSLYIYINENKDVLGAYHAGPNSNGKFAIVTDLGNQLVFQLNMDGSVSGIPGVTAKHVGRQWEIAIPSDQIPAYKKTVNFGLYLMEPMISDISNLDGRGRDEIEYNISYDGNYEDWKDYPHTIIEYATAGTQEEVVDAQGALYSNGSTLYGHVYSEMQNHLDTYNGHEFTTGVTIDLSGNLFYPRVFTADSEGNINWNPKVRDLPNGTYTYYISNTQGWGNAKTLDELKKQQEKNYDGLFGEMTVTITDQRDECEFYLDYEALAAHFGCDATDFKKVRAQFINIGTQWLETAGASSGPAAGILLCIGTVAAVYFFRRKKKGEALPFRLETGMAS